MNITNFKVFVMANFYNQIRSLKQHINMTDIAVKLLAILMLLIQLPANSAQVEIANEPLVNAVPPLALPNLMYILDNSLSMRWEHTPDWVAQDFCKSPSGVYDANCGSDVAAFTAGNQMQDGAPPYRSPDFNNQYYNPTIRYTPPLNAMGVSLGNQSATNAKKDFYDVIETGNINLETNFSDVEWCTSTAYTDCLRNDNYVLPGVVNGKYYGVENNIQWCTTTGYTDCLRNDGSNLLPGQVNNKDYIFVRNLVFATGTKTLAQGTSTTSSKALGPHYYKIIPGEFCDTTKFTNCQTTADGIFKFPAKLRWCNDNTLSNCQALKTGAYQYARYPTVTLPPGTSTITVSGGSTNTTVSSITVGGSQILSASTSANTAANTIASRVVDNINACTIATTGTCAIAGFSASRSGNVITIYAPISATLFSQPVVTDNTTRTFNSTAFTGISKLVPGSFQRVDIVSGQTYPKVTARTDCVANTSSCSYTEEITNFANWYSYYRTRIQMIKTSTSIAFKPIKDKFRIGLVNINSFMDNNNRNIDATDSHYLRINKFLEGAGSQKENWYKSLFNAKLQSTNKTTGTMLRSALANVGRLYAGKAPTVFNASVTAGDPMQYSCQQNYTLLNTDGYWNVDTDADIKNIEGTGNSIGNQDAGSSNPPKSEGSTAVASSNSLADVAFYYYNTDLRNATNCTGSTRPDGTTGDVCDNNVNTSTNDENNQQHMTTFTVGLGVDGSLDYVSDYKDAKSGDFFDIKNGTKSWPKPVAQTETAIDDLWHAAVNGNGSYFSAKDPNVLGASLTKALTEINSTIGAAAAAATSTLNPVSGDNVAFLASYATSQWTGNIEARSINTESGLINPDALWCAEDIGENKCAGDKSVETLNNSTVSYCSTASTSVKCDEAGGSFNTTTNKCKVSYATSCTGTLTQATRANMVTPSTTVVSALEDNRTIYMKDTATSPAASGLTSFKYANLNSTQKTFFETAFLSNNLSHWNLLSSTQQDTASGVNLVNYLRGQNGFDDRETNLDPTTDNRLFRKREAVLGDVLESKPAFIGKTTSRYLDLGYAKFQSENVGRQGTVYVAANDGMLHAFNATVGSNAGKERWAFVPSAVISELYKLADRNYSANHKNYLNGDIIISDICSASCDNASTAVWKTILVAGQNGGGKSYYALDITDPEMPKLLWEFSNLTPTATIGVNYDVGYTFGAPIVTKLPNGIWVVLLTSGYNNAVGKGHLFVLNANTGTVLNDYVTTEGDAATPSGLARISAFAVNPDQNNTSLYVYGGDLLGNLWRFDLSIAPSSSNPLLFATLKAGTVAQPITTAPEIGIINDTRVIFVGTGRYIGTSDLNNKDQQTLYAIKDDNAAATLVNPRSNTASMVQQVISEPTIGTRKIASTQPVEWTTKRGWFIDLPANSGERQNVQSQLVLGTLLVATIVPTAGACSPGGDGWFYAINYLTGGPVSGVIVGRKTNSPIVGLNVVYINGVPKTSIVRSDGTIELRKDVEFNQSVTGFKKKRVIWRELMDPEQ